MISTKGRYALRFLVDIAKNAEGGLVPLKEAAQRQSISEQYLQILAKTLVSAGYIQGVSGKNGGYRLTRDPSEYRVADVLVLMEGTLAPVACLEDCGSGCERKEICDTLPMWKQFDALCFEYFAHITVEDLAKGDLPDVHIKVSKDVHTFPAGISSTERNGMR